MFRGRDEWYRESTRKFAHHGHAAISHNLYPRPGDDKPDDVVKVRAANLLMEMRLKTRHGLEIRAANSADAPDLCKMLNMDGHKIAPRAMAEQLDAIRQEPGAALIAAEWGPPIGLILLHWYRTLELDQPTALITTLLVVPDERRRGIGRLLVKAAGQAARVAGCGALELLAAQEEQALPAFCRATGFTEVGVRFERPLRKKASA